MSPHAAHRARPVAALRTEEEVLQFGREVVSAEARALVDLVEKLDRSFFRAVDLIFKLNGNLIVTGMGNSSTTTITTTTMDTTAMVITQIGSIVGDMTTVVMGATATTTHCGRITSGTVATSRAISTEMEVAATSTKTPEVAIKIVS